MVGELVVVTAESETETEGRQGQVQGRNTVQNQMKENEETWALAVESGAVLLDDDVDIMAILKEQNDELAVKRKMAKQKEKTRRSQPKKLNKLNMLGLVETKRQDFTKFDVARIWGWNNVGWEFVESAGASGGLLLIWDDDLFKANNCYKGERWLCVEGVMMKNNFNCAVCLVYGAHEREEKRVVWEELSYVAGLCQLVDLPLNDRKFTWFRGRSCSRIDRVLVNIEWIEEFPDVRLKGGPRGLSDHCPLIVEDKRIGGGPRPFRTLDSWFTHEDFLRMVKNEWRNLGDGQFTSKLKALAGPLRLWHKNNFGDMEKRLQTLEEEIKKLDNLVSAGVYDGTTEARRRALVSFCEKWYVRKELHWKQMSRSQHAKHMDRNTRFFHNIASARRRNNRIDALLIHGRVVQNQTRIKVAIRGFYKDLYRQEVVPRIGFQDGLVRQIDGAEAAALEVMPSGEEIREAVWDCESSKAPGSDDYNLNFIKRCWEDIGQEFTAAVMDFFQSAKLPADANVTWVTLAPKFVGAKEIKDFRPISMVGCVYKVIFKVLVRRMRTVMPDLVGETQSAFVKGRKIHDGALIACETVQWLKSRRKKATIIKLDFQKAYDRVRWSFVDIVLQKMGFGQRWRSWVKECVTSASMSVLVNGSPSKAFKMERGLRQGDPLSPLLFVLVVDVLHRMFRVAARNGRIAPLRIGRDHIELSHLQFADDTILFCPPEIETIVNYKRLLRCFELMSGLSINFDKSNLIPVNCEQEWVEHVCGLLGCKQAVLPIRYLGIPLGANPRLVKTWKPIIEKVESKLSLWKAKVLNKAGKLILIKSVLNSLPIYYLSLYKMPRAVANKLIALQRSFMWCTKDGAYGMPLVKWEVVQAPKKAGGLGVGDAVVRNAALLFKWWWRFSKEEYPLWKKVVCSCNNLDPSALLSSQILPVKGGPWKDICQLNIAEQQVKEKLISGLAMEVGDGRRTRFWEDNWVQGGPLKGSFPRLFSISNQQGSVTGDCGFWDGLEWVWNFQWKRELFQWELELAHQLHERLRPVKLSVGREDNIVWKFDNKGIFSTNSFMQVLQSETLSAEITSYSFTQSIWGGLVPPRIELFGWFVLVGRVNTKERLSRLGVIPPNDNICALCKKEMETVHHLFLEGGAADVVDCIFYSDLEYLEGTE
ncbi:uncharacterized protein LOC107615862 [Arachis ipaensis]|uniref:uncharacterized protein LOC107615862 n=1 Tax=Arachis ipaensis TaxID=130454 RepID=UPI0007AF51DC|nr:uncharacterized protein LOC107615862 [Arachis ipaensis]